jgi:flagellar basal-body rod protein FlgB
LRRASYTNQQKPPNASGKFRRSPAPLFTNTQSTTRIRGSATAAPFRTRQRHNSCTARSETMLNTLFNNTSVPLLEQVVDFTEARHGVLAGNIANLDTPGYKTRDLSPQLFQEKLREAVEASHARRASGDGYGNYGSYPSQSTDPVGHVDRNFSVFDHVKDSYKSILRHDGVNVSMENQINQVVKNQQEHNLAVNILSSQFRLLRAAISERVA